jgi:uncharacterized membrane protein required for colicin V production
MHPHLDLAAMALDIDTIGLVLIVVFAVMGAARGLWWQVIRLLGLGAAVFVARTFSPRFVPYLQEAFEELDTRLLAGTVWIALFMMSLGLVAGIGRLGRKVLEAAALGFLDRAGGALAGALTGALLHAAIVAALVQVGDRDWVGDLLEGSKSEALVEVLVAKLPLLLDHDAAREAADILGWPWQEPEPAPTPPLPQPDGGPEGTTTDPAPGPSGDN